MPREGADARQAAQKRPALQPLRPAPRHIGAHIGGQQPGEGGQIRRLAQMVRQKMEKLSQVALVGVERMGGGAALGIEMRQPAPGLMGERRGGPGEDQVFPAKVLIPDGCAGFRHEASVPHGS